MKAKKPALERASSSDESNEARHAEATSTDAVNQAGTESKGMDSGPRPVTEATVSEGAGEKPREWIPVWKPSDFINFNPPTDFILVGDCHVVRGGLTVLGGFPGVGKSRGALALAIAGAKCVPWMGLNVHARFRTLIIQCENGPFRLKTELTEALDGSDMDEWIRITPPPPYGLAFREPGFREALGKIIADFKPGLIVIDPWNRTADGDKQADYRAALESVFECLPEAMDERPAILVVHHMRKKGSESTRKRGRDLLHELAGSYTIGSSARCVFALEPATSDLEDQTVVLTCCKNNDGEEGAPSAWIRRNGLFDANPFFDMDAFLSDEGAVRKGRRVNFTAVAKALRGMQGETKTQAVDRLTKAKVCEKSKGYAVLKQHPDHIIEDEGGKLWWKDDDED
jgi:hypothetical protein